MISAEKYHYPDEERKRPAVPKAKDSPPLMGIKTTKNFITTNAVENIMAVPKKPAKNFADTRHGDTFPLEESGLVPKYRNKKVSQKTFLPKEVGLQDFNGGPFSGLWGDA